MDSRHHIRNIVMRQGLLKVLEDRGIHDLSDLPRWRKKRFQKETKIDDGFLNELEDLMKKRNIKWRPELNMNKNQMIQDILEVLDYRDGNYYVGSMANARVSRIIGHSYGNIDDDFDDKLKTSDKKTIKEVYEYLESYIDHMKDHPVTRCPLCMQRVRKEKIQKDIFIVRVETEYVSKLIQNLGKMKARDQLVYECQLEIEKAIENE